MSIIFTPLERLIHLLSNGVTNSIVIDIRLISLEHVTYYKNVFVLNMKVFVTHTAYCEQLLSQSVDCNNPVSISDSSPMLTA